MARRADPWFWLALGLVLVYIRGLFLDVMDVDASQYASISMEMLQDGNWLQVQHRQADYLDKPPLLFWTSALSFALFGLHNWAYKLPSFLGALVGVFAVYRFCLLFYTRQTARLAAFILASSTGVLLLCNDVRTDTLLMGLTACAVWWLARSLNFSNFQFPISNFKLEKNPPEDNIPNNSNLKLEIRNWKSLALAGALLGLAMLAKGPIGLIVPAFAVGAHLLLQRNWRGIFQWRWLLLLAVAGLVLLPMCWGLYQQFDLHPEKTVNHRTGVSGLYFYFWEQSFGRITGENVWKNDTSPFYFLHVYLWAFLPWSLLLIAALWRRLSDLFRQRFRLPAGDEAYSIGAFVLAFVALSMSRYKLPHYIFVTLPWAAVLVARWLTTSHPTASMLQNFSNFKFQISNFKSKKTLKSNLKFEIGNWKSMQSSGRTVQAVIYPILLTAAILLLGFVFPTTNPVKWAIPLGLFGLIAVSYWKNILSEGADGLVQRGVLAAIAVGFVLNFHFYPNLLPCQSTATVPRYARQQGIPAEKMAFFNRHGHALDFYAGRILEQLDSAEKIRQKALDSGVFWLYTDEAGRAELDSAGLQYEQTAKFSHFQVALLKSAFLNPATREASLQPVFLLKILEQQ